MRLARAAVAAGEWAAADDFVALAGRADQPGSLIVLADSAHGAARIEAAARLAQAAVERARAARVADVRCDALCCQARILRLSDPSHARAAFAEAVQVASEHGMPARRLDGLFGLGTIELLEEQAPGTLQQARRLALDLGLVDTVAQSDVLLAEHALVHDGQRPTRVRVAADRACPAAPGDRPCPGRRNPAGDRRRVDRLRPWSRAARHPLRPGPVARRAAPAAGHTGASPVIRT